MQGRAEVGDGQSRSNGQEERGGAKRKGNVEEIGWIRGASYDLVIQDHAQEEQPCGDIGSWTDDDFFQVVEEHCSTSFSGSSESRHT